MKERRATPRARCRLACRVLRGRDQIPARVLDVSEGGLCVLSPVELEVGYIVRIEIDVPARGPSEVQVRVWHVRKNQRPSTGEILWSVGMLMLKSDDSYKTLLPPARPIDALGPGVEDAADYLEAYRVRIQIRGEPRTRLLNLAATSEAEARRMALADVDESWSVVEVRKAIAGR